MTSVDIYDFTRGVWFGVLFWNAFRALFIDKDENATFRAIVYLSLIDIFKEFIRYGV